MKRNLLKISSSLLTFLVICSNTVLAGFFDVSEDHKNLEAINYLQEQQVINGYPDGSFRPNQDVNRVEFLKIIIEGSNIQTEINNATPFPDVDHAAWYGTYVKHAYASGWINGYPDGTFKPEQTINKVEALKILAKAQNWVIDPLITVSPYADTSVDAWYTPYIAYAKKSDYLEETGNFFNPAEEMQRGSISQVIYQTLIAEEEEDDEEIIEPTPEEIENPETEEEANFNAIDFQLISKNFFDDITLSKELPKHFYKNETYSVQGTILSGNPSKATIILSSKENGTKTTFSGTISNQKFSIPVHFRTSGNYLLGIIPGESGSSMATEISVLKELPNSSNLSQADKPSGANISYADDITKVTFPASTSALTKLVFTQSDETVTYLSRQNLGEIKINYKDFENFDTSQVSYHLERANFSSAKPLQISSEFSIGDSKKFNPIEHSFDSINENNIITSPPDTMPEPETLKITGMVKTKTKIVAYITKPDGFVDEANMATTTPFNDQLIAINGDFSLTYTIPKTGRYIFEINNENGEAIMNHPIYVGNFIPLLPDFFDLHEKKLFSGTFNLSQLRSELLQQINQSRQEHGLETITLSGELNDLAQAHAADMQKNNFFAHNNLQGKTPEERRIEAGIETAVGENLSRDVNISSVHYGLMRSGAHRKNILSDDWTRIGLGIVEDEGYLTVAEEFSTTPLTADDLLKYRDELISEVNEARVKAGQPALSTSDSLNNTAKYLNDKNIIEDKSLTTEIFQEAIAANNITGASQAIARIFNIWDEILESILEEDSEFNNAKWDLMGVDIQLNKTGNIHATLILNNPS